jgi:hypothetical protein
MYIISRPLCREQRTLKNGFIVRYEKICHHCILGLMYSANLRLGSENLMGYTVQYASKGFPVFQWE